MKNAVEAWETWSGSFYLITNIDINKNNAEELWWLLTNSSITLVVQKVIRSHSFIEAIRLCCCWAITAMFWFNNVVAGFISISADAFVILLNIAKNQLVPKILFWNYVELTHCTIHRAAPYPLIWVCAWRYQPYLCHSIVASGWRNPVATSMTDIGFPFISAATLHYLLLACQKRSRWRPSRWVEKRRKRD